jgi:hypothetical protein
MCYIDGQKNKYSVLGLIAKHFIVIYDSVTLSVLPRWLVLLLPLQQPVVHGLPYRGNLQTSHQLPHDRTANCIQLLLLRSKLFFLCKLSGVQPADNLAASAMMAVLSAPSKPLFMFKQTDSRALLADPVCFCLFSLVTSSEIRSTKQHSGKFQRKHPNTFLRMSPVVAVLSHCATATLLYSRPLPCTMAMTRWNIIWGFSFVSALRCLRKIYYLQNSFVIF